MNADRDRLYDLLPGVYRKRDAELGQPLRALLRVIGEQVDVVERDITQLYDNWFIETCEEWVVPYIAELLGFTAMHEAGVLVPRAEVAHTIRYRRRRGTLAVLESLARDVAGWPARAVEFYQLLAVAQHLNHLHLERGRFADLRHGDALDRVDGPFDEIAHTVDVRRAGSNRRPGRYNIPNIGLFVWRLKEYSITRSPAYHLERRARYRGRNRYTFSALANDMQLYTHAIVEPEPAHIADEMSVPAPIRRRAFHERTADYYGPGKSLVIWVDDLETPVPLERIVAADLSNWVYSPVGDMVAIDPELGRIALASDRKPAEVRVSYHYVFSADMGGGEYPRTLRPVRGRRLYSVSQQDDSVPFQKIGDAIDAWSNDPDQHPDAIIEINDSGVYNEQLEIAMPAGRRLELRARDGARPVIRLSDERTSRGDSLLVTGPQDETEGKRDPQLLLNGLLVAGRGLQIAGRISRVFIRHCTLVPGWTLDESCEPQHETEPSIELLNTTARLTIEHSITGSILVDQNEVTTDPLPMIITDSIVDATHPRLDAIGVSGSGNIVGHVVLTIARCTVIGTVSVHAFDLGENCIFLGKVKAARTQTGCIRFCYVPEHSRTPRRYHCQPDLVTAGLTGSAAQLAALRVRPRFNSLRYGTPTYCQLALNCAMEILRGADDESEMGAFHDLFGPQRLDNLRIRLDEFTPANAQAGIIPAT